MGFPALKKMSAVIRVVIRHEKRCKNDKKFVKTFGNATTVQEMVDQCLLTEQQEMTPGETLVVWVNEFKIPDSEKDTICVGDLTNIAGTGSFMVEIVILNAVLPTNDTSDPALDVGQPLRPSAFDVLMRPPSRAPPKKKSVSAGVKDRLSRKDELYNDLCVDLMERGIDFPRESSDNSYILQVLCNTLWYMTNQHETLERASSKHRGVKCVPKTFSQYTGYNEIRRKKVKSQKLDTTSLNSHSEALYTLLQKPIFSHNDNWRQLKMDIAELAECLASYREFLLRMNLAVQTHHTALKPARTIDEHAAVEYRHKTAFVRPVYSKIDGVMQRSDLNQPVIFQEDENLHEPFTNAKARQRYFENLYLSVPVDLISFCPGGSIITTFCLLRVEEQRTDREMMTQAATGLQKVRAELGEYHTRAMRAAFRSRLSNVVRVLPAVADMIYQFLTLDKATVSHPVTVQRVRLIFLGHEGLIDDLRHLSAGRPSTHFDYFFEKLQIEIDSVVAADDRRHGVAHIAEWISLRELVERTAARCPPGTPIPSKELVRLQFAPRNPYSHAALSFTGKIQVQYKIQTRQLRVQHPDDHYASAQFKYLRAKAAELGPEKAVMFCADDKAKIPIGSPNAPISTGVRGKKTLTPSSTNLTALDHDMHKCSLTPSVYLQNLIPDSPEKSFYRGVVTTIVNDSVFQSSDPFRHAAALVKILENQERRPVMLRFSDGGTDQRNTLESVKLASISIFLETELDMLVIARCAPGHSWLNPAERIMSILNLGLQNCALERPTGDDDFEKKIKNCNSMAALREKSEVREKWLENMQPVQELVANRFKRLSLKSEPIRSIAPVAQFEVDRLKSRLKEKFPTLDFSKPLTKKNTAKCRDYIQWLEQHVRCRQYITQFRKCSNLECCPRPRLEREDMEWVPDPVLADDSDHYKSYAEVKGTETTDGRPTLASAGAKKRKAPLRIDLESESTVELPPTLPPMEVRVEDTEPELEMPNLEKETTWEPAFQTSLKSTAQNAKASVHCIDCRKPRVLYCTPALTSAEKEFLDVLLEDNLYTCGAPISAPDHVLHERIMTRRGLTCAIPIELPYYSHTTSVGRKDLCAWCGVEETVMDPELVKKFQSVRPSCPQCMAEGFEPITAREIGRTKKTKK